MYLAARKHFREGGPRRIKYTLVPIIFGCFRLSHRLIQEGKESGEDSAGKVKKVFKIVYDEINVLVKEYPTLSFNLYLQASLAVDKCGDSMETIAYDFLTQAFSIYEEQISDSQAQFNCLVLITGTLKQLTTFTVENYDNLVTKTALHSSKLLKKPDQCRAVCGCSHLFFRDKPEYLNEKRVLECLQKSLKIADSCVDSAMNVHLFVEILNQYIYFFENKCSTVTVDYLSGLIALINTKLTNLDSTSDSTLVTEVNATFKNIQQFLELKKKK